MPITTNIEVITPQIAMQMLEKNHLNRPVKNRMVLKIANDISAGRFVLNGEGIIFSDTDKLLDGQHRLNAVVSADAEITSVVIRGVPESVFSTLDSGIGRTAGEILAIAGVKSSFGVGAAARLVQHRKHRSHIQSGSISRDQITDYALSQPYLQELVRSCRHKGSPVPANAVAAVVFLGNESREYDVQAEDFISHVMSGEELKRGDARLALRTYFLNNKRIHKDTAFVIIAIAWNKYMQGEETFQLKVGKQDFSSVPIFGELPVEISKDFKASQNPKHVIQPANVVRERTAVSVSPEAEKKILNSLSKILERA